MEVLKVTKKSGSGSTKWVDRIYFEIDKPNTYASSILLKNYYWDRDEDNAKSIANRMRMIGFSRTYLTHIKETTGNLCCSYCSKKNLIIELHGMKVSSARKATIDHIIPISNGGALFDYSNITVACGTCNRKKGSLSLEEFKTKYNKNLEEPKKSHTFAINLNKTKMEEFITKLLIRVKNFIGILFIIAFAMIFSVIFLVVNGYLTLEIGEFLVKHGNPLYLVLIPLSVILLVQWELFKRIDRSDKCRKIKTQIFEFFELDDLD